MTLSILIDTGPLVALVNRREDAHQWVSQRMANLSYPFVTCEAVITEACFLLQNIYGGEDAVMGLVESQRIMIPFVFCEEVKPIRQLINRYSSVPMSFADACLVRMSELINNSVILTLDSDFLIYRKNRNEMIDLMIPDELNFR